MSAPGKRGARGGVSKADCQDELRAVPTRRTERTGIVRGSGDRPCQDSKLSRAFKHSTQSLATTPAPVRTSCGVSFWQMLQ